MQLLLLCSASVHVVAVESLQVKAPLLHLNWRQASGEVSHTWLTGASTVPVITLLVVWATLLRVMDVTPFASVPAPMLTSHWANPAPFAKPVFTLPTTARKLGGLLLPGPA